MIPLLFLAFISGFMTILAPCIWPLFPIIFSTSSGPGRQRPLGISLGIVSSFTLLTLSVSYIEKIIPVAPNVFRTVAVIIILVLGIVMMVPQLSTALEGLFSRLPLPRPDPKGQTKSGLAAGYWTGFLIGGVWAPCAGPILAAVATLAALQAVDLKVVAIALSYGAGLAVPLFLFALSGSLLFQRLRRFNRYTGRIQQIMGAILVISTVLIFTNYDKILQVKILDAFPGFSQLLAKLNNDEQAASSLSLLQPAGPAPASVLKEPADLTDQGPAPDFVGISHWLNTYQPLSLSQLAGKVVLVDFWTYSCINCVRTLPHLTAWYEEYKNAGLVIIGVHTPEFAFEKETVNVARALKQFGIHYPVAQDNDFQTWQAYHNRYWPAEYLIDGRGHIRRTHFGEGEYEETEEAIRALLQESGQDLASPARGIQDATPKASLTPETYLGLARLERFSSPEQPREGRQRFTRPAEIMRDHLVYTGTWDLSAQAAQADPGATLEIRFHASHVFLVIGPGPDKGAIRVLLDGAPLPDEMAGADVRQGQLILDTERLYEVVNLGRPAETHVLQLKFEHGGTALYAFTFG